MPHRADEISWEFYPSRTFKTILDLACCFVVAFFLLVVCGCLGIVTFGVTPAGDLLTQRH
jgi:hypothetical protein